MLAASAEAEVGGQGSEAKHAYIESVFNRALSRNKTIKETISDRGYYPNTTLNKLNRQVGDKEQIETNDIANRVMRGSNVSNYATGNESGVVTSGGAPVTRDFGPHRERFVRENKDIEWVNKQVNRDTGGQGFPSGNRSQALPDPSETVSLLYPSQTRTEISVRKAPLNRVKVTNHSDEDVSTAKTISDQDAGDLEPAEDLTK
jgi:hypothetical protein